MVVEGLVATLLGFLGTGLTTFSNYKLKQLEIAAERDKRGHELDMVKAESSARIEEVRAQIEVATVATEGAVLMEEAKAFTESQKQGNKASFDSKWMTNLFSRTDAWRFLTIPLGTALCFLFGISDAVKSCMRSALTVYAAALATWITYQSWIILEKSGLDTVSTSQALEVFDVAMRTGLAMAVTIIMWWFGDRRVAKHLMHLSQEKKGE